MDIKEGSLTTTVDASGILMKNADGQQTVLIDAEDGNLHVGGLTTIKGHIMPADNAQYDLGSAEKKIRHLFLSDNSLWVGDQHKISVGADGKFKLRKLKTKNLSTLKTIEGITDDDFEDDEGVGSRIWTESDTYASTMKNVGIGTTNPSASLETPGTIIAGNSRLSYSWHSSYAGFAHKNHTGTGNYCLLHDATGSTFLNSSSGKHIRFRNNNVDRMILTDTGRLGIGHTSPAAELDVKGTVIVSSTDSADGRHFGLKIERAGITGQAYANLTLNSRANHSYEGIDFQMNGVSKMFLELSGDLGIGTTSPVAPLHIIGKYASNDQNINIVFQNRYKKTQIGIGMDDSDSDEDGDLYFLRKYPGASSWTRIGRLLEQNGNDATMNFTGAHNCRFSNEEIFEICLVSYR